MEKKITEFKKGEWLANPNCNNGLVLPNRIILHCALRRKSDEVELHLMVERYQRSDGVRWSIQYKSEDYGTVYDQMPKPDIDQQIREMHERLNESHFKAWQN